MALRYWVGGTANWDATAGTKWATSSGGAGGAAVPTNTDDVFFDAASGANTVTISASASAKSIDCTGFTGTLAGSSALGLRGNFTLVAGMTYTYSGTITVTTNNCNFTSAGKSITNPITINGSGIVFQLQDNTTATGTWAVTQGTFDTNNKTFQAAGLSSSGNSSKTLTFGSSTITLTGATPINFSGSNMTITASTSTITCNTTSAISFAGNGQTFNNVTFSAMTVSNCAMTGANSFNNLTFTGAAVKVAGITLASNITVTGTFTVNGNSAINRLLIYSSSLGTQITITSAANSFTNLDLQDISGAGAASWNLAAITGNSGDCGGNSNITFTTGATQTATGTASFTWSTHGWTSRVPLPQDDVVINNSFVAGRTITVDMPRIGKNIDFTSVSGSPTLSISPSNVTLFGSLTLASGLGTISSNLFIFQPRSNVSITTNGKTLTGVFMNGVGSTLTFQDNCTGTSAFTLLSGTADFNNKDTQWSSWSTSGTLTRVMNMGNGICTITATGTIWSVSTLTGLTFNCGYSTVKITSTSASSRTFAGKGQTYWRLWSSAGTSTGSLTISGSNFFYELKDDGTAAHSWLFTDGTTQTITKWNISGASGAVITINGTSTGTHTLQLSGSGGGGGNGFVNADYLNIQHSIALPGDMTWYAGSNSTNNQAVATAGSGWLFEAYPNSSMGTEFLKTNF